MAVYFIRAGEKGPVKIGHSMRPEERARDLQHAHYEKLYVIRVVDDACAPIETWFKHRFSRLRIRGEWFHFDPEMLTLEWSPNNPPESVVALAASGEAA